MYVFITMRWASRKSHTRVLHHNFSTSPNQPVVSISLRTADRPGIARLRLYRLAQFWRRRYSPALSTEYVSCGCDIEYGDASLDKMRWYCGRKFRRTGTRAPDMRRQKQTGSAARWHQARQQLHCDRGPLSRLSNTVVRGRIIA